LSAAELGHVATERGGRMKYGAVAVDLHVGGAQVVQPLERFETHRARVAEHDKPPELAGCAM
jgi:hypothetical protein